MDIISDMRLTVSSLDSKEALTNIDKVYMDYDTSNLHAILNRPSWIHLDL